MEKSSDARLETSPLHESASKIPGADETGARIARRERMDDRKTASAPESSARGEIVELYRHSSTEELGRRAREVCEKVHGSEILLRALIEFSNDCSLDCLYCGIRAGNAAVERYRLEPDELVAAAEIAYAAGLRSFVLQSAEDPWYTTRRLAGAVERVRERCPDAAITLSCGIKTLRQYRDLRSAGADRYLLRFETSDPELHRYLRGGISLERRLRALEDLRTAGYQVGSGFMVGLPGETEETRIANALLSAELELDMVGIGPFIDCRRAAEKLSGRSTVYAGQAGRCRH